MLKKWLNFPAGGSVKLTVTSIFKTLVWWSRLISVRLTSVLLVLTLDAFWERRCRIGAFSFYKKLFAELDHLSLLSHLDRLKACLTWIVYFKAFYRICLFCSSLTEAHTQSSCRLASGAMTLSNSERGNRKRDLSCATSLKFDVDNIIVAVGQMRLSVLSLTVSGGLWLGPLIWVRLSFTSWTATACL